MGKKKKTSTFDGSHPCDHIIIIAALAMNTSAYLTALLVRETCFKCQTSRDTEEKIEDLN